MDADRSVRVEVEQSYAGHAPTPGTPEPPSSSPGRGVAIGVGIVALIGVVLAVVLLRPSDGETAAGTQRSATTSTASTTTTAAPTTTSTTPSEAEAVDDPNAGTFDRFDPLPGNVVRTESGFLGLSFDFEREGPSLHRTVHHIRRRQRRPGEPQRTRRTGRRTAPIAGFCQPREHEASVPSPTSAKQLASLHSGHGFASLGTCGGRRILRALSGARRS